VRLALLAWPRLWFDEATTGLLGLAVLRGELPVYFFGQPFMGALDGYLAAPVYLALGPSAWTLELVPVLLSLVWMGLVVRFAWDAFGLRAALYTALLVALPPDFALRWSHEARNHYPLAMVLGTLALLVALRVPEARPRRETFQASILGLILGLAFWTNFLAVVFGPAVGVLLLRNGLRPVWPGMLMALPGFVLGSLPHWLYGLGHGTALPPPGPAIGLTAVLQHLRYFVDVAWPLVSGVAPGVSATAGGPLLAVLLLGLYAAAGVSVLGAIGRPGPGRAASLAVLALAVVNVGTAVGTQYGRGLDDNDPRYLLPLYTAGPLLLGRWLAGWASARVAAGVAAALLVVHGAGAIVGSFRMIRPTAGTAARAELRAQLDTVAALEQAGLRYLYAPDSGTRIFTFLSNERVVFSNHYEEAYPAYARAVDGAGQIGWWVHRPVPDLEANLAALGASFRFQQVGPLGGAYVDFSLPARVLTELDPEGLTVTASENAAGAAYVLDRDASTLWSASRPRRGGEWIQVDLGAVVSVALIRWLPGTYQEVPTGLALDASVDGVAWFRLLAVPAYIGPLYWSAGQPFARVRSGRVELRVPPTPLRYLRVTQTGRSPLWGWTMRELFVYADAGAAPPPQVDGPTLARRVREAGVRHLYADHGWGSRVARSDPGIRVMPANLQLDAYGFRGPAAWLLPPFRWAAGSGVLLEPVDAAAFARMAERGGLAFERQPVDGLELLTYLPAKATGGSRLPPAELTVTASRQPELAGRMVDGDPASRWGTGRPQAVGDWVSVAWARPRRVRGLRLWTASPTDAPRGVSLEGSEDGERFEPIPVVVRTEGAYRWGGIALLRDGVEGVWIELAPRSLRALRVVLTRGDPVFDWSVHDLAVHAAD
jgi:hypothetical protein